MTSKDELHTELAAAVERKDWNSVIALIEDKNAKPDTAMLRSVIMQEGGGTGDIAIFMMEKGAKPTTEMHSFVMRKGAIGLAEKLEHYGAEPAINIPLVLVTKAFNFAAQRHKDQRRKGLLAEPYINHPAEVGELLAEFTNGTDPVLVAAGLLHDTVEDTGVTYCELKDKFGQKVMEIVKEVSDDKTLPKLERKRLQIEHAAHASDQAKQLKMADKISNLRSILNSPPADWSDERKLEYFNWSKKVVDNCRSANAGLAACFDETYKQGVKAFKPTI